MGSFWSQTTTFVVLHRRLFNADNGTCGSCQQTGPFENLQHIGHDISQKREEQQGAINEGPNSGTVHLSLQARGPHLDEVKVKVEKNSLHNFSSFNSVIIPAKLKLAISS